MIQNSLYTARAWRVLARRTAMATLVASIGCGSGGGPAGPAAAPTAPMPPDTGRATEVNRRIMSAGSLDTAAAPASDYRIGAQDVIDVEVFGVETFSGTYRVDQAGEIALPLIGSVPASGQTARQLEESLEARLAATYVRDPHVTVEIGEMRSHGVSVIGAVNRPGVYQIPGPATLLDVLAQAEGLREDAGGRVFVVRGARPASSQHASGGVTAGMADTETSATSGTVPPTSGDTTATAVAAGRSSTTVDGAVQQVVEVDLGALLESGRAEENVVVRPGDIVQVRPAGLVYVVGEVNRPGGFTVPPGRPMSVLQALAMAQGLANMADADDGVIVREHEDGSREEIPVDLDKVLDGSEAPPALVERDVLFVPKNGTKSFALGVVDNLVRMVTFRGLVY